MVQPDSDPDPVAEVVGDTSAKTDLPTIEPVETPHVDDPDPQARAEACWRVMQQVLATYQCELRVFIADPEPVGRDGGGMLLRPSFGIHPNPLKP